jgi:hypothetical protein
MQPVAVLDTTPPEVANAEPDPFPAAAASPPQDPEPSAASKNDLKIASFIPVLSEGGSEAKRADPAADAAAADTNLGSITQDSISAEHFIPKFSPSIFGQIST